MDFPPPDDYRDGTGFSSNFSNEKSPEVLRGLVSLRSPSWTSRLPMTTGAGQASRPGFLTKKAPKSSGAWSRYAPPLGLEPRTY